MLDGYIETSMVIQYVSHKHESFTLLKLTQIYRCKHQNLQIPIFVVYELSSRCAVDKKNQI